MDGNMICKECGAELGVEDTSCAACGATVPSKEGGVGFWDLLDGAPEVRPADGMTDMGTLPGMPTITEKEESAAAGWPKRIRAVAGAVGAAIMIGLAASNYFLFSSLNELRNQVTAADAELELQVSALDGRVLTQEKGADIVAEDLSVMRDTIKEPPQLIVTTEPSGSTVTVGLSDAEEPLLTYELLGTVVSFRWEHKDDRGRWDRISFDAKTGLNAQLGLRLEEDLDAGVSRLWTSGITKDAAGAYRCVATDLHGKEVEATADVMVVLAEENKDDDRAEGVSARGESVSADDSSVAMKGAADE